MMVAFEFLSLLHCRHFEISKKTMYTFDTCMIATAVQCRTIYLCFNNNQSEELNPKPDPACEGE
jgi:hypothetical protein